MLKREGWRWKRRSTQGAVKKKTVKKASTLKLALNSVILLLIFASVGIYFFMLPQFPIRRVLVEHGNDLIDAPLLKALISPQVKKGFFYTQVSEIQKNLDALPWVEQAIVEKKWPDTLEVHLKVRKTVAHWNSTSYLVSNGEIYHSAQVLNPAVLPFLNGPDEEALPLLEEYYAFRADLLSDALSIQSLTETSDREYVAVLSNDVTLKLGADHLQERMHRFVKAYPLELIDKVNNIAYVDLRYENGLAVGFRLPENKSSNLKMMQTND